MTAIIMSFRRSLAFLYQDRTQLSFYVMPPSCCKLVSGESLNSCMSRLMHCSLPELMHCSLPEGRSTPIRFETNFSLLVPARRRLRGKQSPPNQWSNLPGGDPDNTQLQDENSQAEATSDVLNPESEHAESVLGALNRHTMRTVVAKLLRGRDLTQIKFGDFRTEIATALQLPPNALDDHKEVLRGMLDKLVRKEMQQQILDKAVAANDRKRKQPVGETTPAFCSVATEQVLTAYLVTWSSPASAESEAKKPDDFSREEFAQLLINALDACQADKRVYILQLVVFRECHANGQPHFHCAVRLNKNQRWRPWKQQMMDDHGIQLNFRTCSKGSESPFSVFCLNVFDFVLASTQFCWTIMSADFV